MPPKLFRSRMFLGVNIVTVFLYGCLIGVLFLLPFELIARRGMTAAQVGLAMVPFGLIIGLGSRIAGSMSDRMGPRPFLVAGSALVTLGCVVFAVNVPDFWLGVQMPLLLMSFGMALVVSPLTTAVMNAVPDERSGAARGSATPPRAWRDCSQSPCSAGSAASFSCCMPTAPAPVSARCRRPTIRPGRRSRPRSAPPTRLPTGLEPPGARWRRLPPRSFFGRRPRRVRRRSFIHHPEGPTLTPTTKAERRSGGCASPRTWAAGRRHSSRHRPSCSPSPSAVPRGLAPLSCDEQPSCTGSPQTPSISAISTLWLLRRCRDYAR